MRIAPLQDPAVSSNLSLFSDDCERIGSFSSSFFLIQQVSSHFVSLLSWPADVGSLVRLLRIFGKLESSWPADPFPPTVFMFGEFLSSRDGLIGPGSRPDSCSQCIGKSRAFKVARGT